MVRSNCHRKVRSRSDEFRSTRSALTPQNQEGSNELSVQKRTPQGLAPVPSLTLRRSGGSRKTSATAPCPRGS